MREHAHGASVRQIREQLLAIDVPVSMSARVPGLVRGTRGFLVYGSRARGDSLPESDLDILALVDSARASASVDDVNVSYYTSAQLRSGAGTLFGAHLRRDSLILADAEGELGDLIGRMGEVDVQRLFDRARQISTLFSALDVDLPRYLDGLTRHARYLLRSCLYAQAIEEGRPCFSVREIARRRNDPALATILSSRHSASPQPGDLRECLDRLERVLGGLSPSIHGSLEATIVNEWGRPSDLLSASFMVLGSTGSGSMYAEVEKILL